MLPCAVRPLLCTLLLIAIRSGRSQDLKLPDTPETLHLAPSSDRFPTKWYPNVGDGTEVLPAPVTNHPYTAVPGKVAPASAKAQIAPEAGFQARDRLGRTRSEAQSGGMSIDGKDVKIETVTVSDPVSHCDFHWMQPIGDTKLPAEVRVAFVTCRSQTLRYKEVDLEGLVLESLPEGTSQSGDTTIKTEHLTPLHMNGFTVNRLRVTNSRPDEKGKVVSWSTETWYSPELREIIRLGNEQEGYTGLTKIQLVDPDPKLFFPPEDYRIETQPARR